MRWYSYTERFCTDRLLHADTFTHRGSQRFLRKKKKTHRSFYTNALHKDVFARINKSTQALLHTEPLAQRNKCTEQLLHKETFTQENFDTEKLVHTDCTKKFLHTETFTRRNFTQSSFLHKETFPHRSLYAQKPLCTAVFTHTFLHTDAFTQKTFTHKLVHTSRFYTQPVFTRRGFASPFLITYLSCSPSQVALLISSFFCKVCQVPSKYPRRHCVCTWNSKPFGATVHSHGL